MEGSVERRGSLYIPAWTDVVDHHSSVSHDHLRSPSPEQPKSVSPKPQGSKDKVEASSGSERAASVSRHRTAPEIQYADTEVEELFAMLRESESLDEQGDILQYLVDSKGLDFNTGKSSV